MWICFKSYSCLRGKKYCTDCYSALLLACYHVRKFFSRGYFSSNNKWNNVVTTFIFLRLGGCTIKTGTLTVSKTYREYSLHSKNRQHLVDNNVFFHLPWRTFFTYFPWVSCWTTNYFQISLKTTSLRITMMIMQLLFRIFTVFE